MGVEAVDREAGVDSRKYEFFWSNDKEQGSFPRPHSAVRRMRTETNHWT